MKEKQANLAIQIMKQLEQYMPVRIHSISDNGLPMREKAFEMCYKFAGEILEQI